MLDSIKNAGKQWASSSSRGLAEYGLRNWQCRGKVRMTTQRRLTQVHLVPIHVYHWHVSINVATLQLWEHNLKSFVAWRKWDTFASGDLNKDSIGSSWWPNASVLQSLVAMVRMVRFLWALHRAHPSSSEGVSSKFRSEMKAKQSYKSSPTPPWDH